LWSPALAAFGMNSHLQAHCQIEVLRNEDGPNLQGSKIGQACA